jgi:signal transduction histidine kinase/DNA-binding response OmpR family regulator/ligand-binding sensor domain-containing protein
MYGISMREANSICKDSNGFIWVSSKTGILRLTEDDYRRYQLPYTTVNVVSVNLVCEHSTLLAFTNNGQIFLYNQIYDRFDLVVNLRKELNNNDLNVSSILIDDNDTYWIAASLGLYVFHNHRLNLMINDHLSIYRLIWYDDQQIILAKADGLLLLNTKTQQSHYLYHSETSSSFRISTLFMDKKKKRLWVGTFSDGLYYYDFEKALFTKSKTNTLPKQPILAIESISDSTLLLGIDGQGLWEINKKGDRVAHIYKEDADDPSSLRGNGVYDIYCDQGKRVWVATYSGGVSYFDQSSPIVTQIVHHINNSNSLANNDVNGVVEDSRGNMWFATNNGISYWNISDNQWKNFYVNKQEQAQVFLTLCEDNQGRIWAGTYSSGVYVLDRETGKQLAHYSQLEENTPFINDYVFDILKDSQGDIWIGGVNSEIVQYQPNKNSFKKYPIQPVYILSEMKKGQMLLGCTYGLSLLNSETSEIETLVRGCLVQDILVFGGFIWVGTSGDGLIRFDPEKGVSEKFTTQNGLPSDFVNSVTYSDGYLWLGTENGLCQFDPDEKSAHIYSSIISLSSSSFNRNAHCNLGNGQLAWGTNNGVLIFNPKTIQHPQSPGKIFLQDISISGRSIRELPALKLNKPLDEWNKITLKYNQNTLTFELLPIGVASGAKFSWKLEGLDKDWAQPVCHHFLSYSNIPSKTYNLKIRMYDNSLSQILAERTFIIKITPPFWATSWFLVILFFIVTTIIYLGFWYYINMLKQRHTEEKIRFFTNTAHDLRTSLTLIKAPVEELTKETNLSEPGKHYLRLAIKQTRRLSSFVTQLLEFQKADVGKGQVSFAMVDIVDFINRRIQMFESLAQGKELLLSFKTNVPEYSTAIDEQTMERVIDNLISNAVKYSFPSTTVQIFLNCSENKWVLEVKDQGIGISKKAQRQLFKEFYRGENAVNSKIVGTGIGLLLVRNYVALHGGHITCSSQENVGSTFQITVPHKEVAEKTRHEYKDQTSAQLFDLQNIVGHKKIEASGKTTTKEMRILLVEDNDDLLRFMQLSLEKDFDVYTTDDGEKAWEVIQKQQPDLVVSDVMMPNKDGFELCELLKSTFETSHIPIILLTALSEKTAQLRGLGLGADDYVTKPFDMAILRQKIKTIISNREAIRGKALKLIKGDTDEPILSNELNDQFVKKMLEVVRNNISNSVFNKDDFASAMNVSPSLLYKKIKLLTNQSPSDFIKVVRLDHASDLLQSKKYSVTEVSELCGFSSVGYFSKVFKKHFGKSPTEI